MPDPIVEEDAVAAAATRLLGYRPAAVEPIRGAGRNSGVYRVRHDNEFYALKRYPARDEGGRDRAGIELAALGFMQKHGIACVPRPLAGDAERGYALLEWIDGEAVTAPNAADITAASAFLAAIHRLRQQPDARQQPPAAEACLSGSEIVAQIERRLVRLDDAAGDAPELADFLAGKARPLLAEIGGWAAAGYARAGLVFDQPITPALQTLCPADFGFHNALRRPSGELVFIDFDYFGWDDPAKLTADFLLHPGMRLSETLKMQFAAAALDIYGDDKSFRARLRYLYPLFALRWCTILLNEFLPERWAHRVNAGGAADWAAAKQRQLDRAREWAHSLSTDITTSPMPNDLAVASSRFLSIP